MYESIKTKTIKVVHKDGERVEISVGVLLDYDADVKTLKIQKSSGKIIFINALIIDKLEVLE